MVATHTGSCFCGAVTISVTGDPVTEGYCHCGDCRAWTGTPMIAYAMWPKDKVAIEGAEHLGTFTRNDTTIRRSCSKCGSPVLVEMVKMGLIDVFPSRLPSHDFTPAAHVHYAARTINIADDLPKFADLPAQAGGSGRMIGD